MHQRFRIHLYRTSQGSCFKTESKTFFTSSPQRHCSIKVHQGHHPGRKHEIDSRKWSRSSCFPQQQKNHQRIHYLQQKIIKSKVVSMKITLPNCHLHSGHTKNPIRLHFRYELLLGQHQRATYIIYSCI